MQPFVARIRLLLLYGAVVLYYGCAPEYTVYRRPAMVIQPRPDLTHIPMQDAIVEISGGFEFNPLEITHFNYAPEDGDSGLHIVELSTFFRIRAQPHERVVFGAEYFYGKEKHSFPNATGLPEISKSIIHGGGPFVHYIHPLRVTDVTISVGGGVNVLGLPWELWRINNRSCTVACLTDDYTRTSSDVDINFQYRLSTAAHWNINKFTLLYANISLQNAFTNTGFHSTDLQGSTIENDFGAIFQFGSRFTYDYLFLDIGGYLSLGYAYGTSVGGPGVFLGGGFRFEPASNMAGRPQSDP